MSSSDAFAITYVPVIGGNHPPLPSIMVETNDRHMFVVSEEQFVKMYKLANRGSYSGDLSATELLLFFALSPHRPAAAPTMDSLLQHLPPALCERLNGAQEPTPSLGTPKPHEMRCLATDEIEECAVQAAEMEIQGQVPFMCSFCPEQNYHHGNSSLFTTVAGYKQHLEYEHGCWNNVRVCGCGWGFWTAVDLERHRSQQLTHDCADVLKRNGHHSRFWWGSEV